MPVSSGTFIPTVITASTSSPWPRMHPYVHPEPQGHFRPGVIHSVGDARDSRSRGEQLPPEEEERRRLRRERNKMAAAKCRSRRSQLTDQLEVEVEKLEVEKAQLQKEVETLQKERARLELVLGSHTPGCQLPGQARPPRHPDTRLSLGTVVVKQEPAGDQDDQREAPVIHVPQPSVIKPVVGLVDIYNPKGDGLNSSTGTRSVFSYHGVPEQESHSETSPEGGASGDHAPISLLCPSLLAL